MICSTRSAVCSWSITPASEWAPKKGPIPNHELLAWTLFREWIFSLAHLVRIRCTNMKWFYARGCCLLAHFARIWKYYQK